MLHGPHPSTPTPQTTQHGAAACMRHTMAPRGTSQSRHRWCYSLHAERHGTMRHESIKAQVVLQPAGWQRVARVIQHGHHTFHRPSHFPQTITPFTDHHTFHRPSHFPQTITLSTDHHTFHRPSYMFTDHHTFHRPSHFSFSRTITPFTDHHTFHVPSHLSGTITPFTDHHTFPRPSHLSQTVTHSLYFVPLVGGL